jgi:hypothetical protein
MDIAIPSSERVDPRRVQDIVERIARLERRPTEEISDATKYLWVDVTNLRAANDYLIADSIPLNTAASMVAAARVMLRATGTTSRRERAEIRGNYAPQGDEVVKSASMAHTREGSFVIPILVPLPEVSEPNTPQQPLVELIRSAPEPFARRVTRTFAMALNAVHDLIVEPATEPTVARLHEAVERGVSREFCAALARVLAEPVVSEFEARFDWAPALPGPSNLRQISIDSAAQLHVAQAAEKLRTTRIEPRRNFSGKIDQLRHVEGTDIGEIWISTIRHGKACEIKVVLPMDVYTSALEWHGQGRAVIVEGQVKTDTSRRLYVDSPERCYPMDQTYLDGGTFDSVRSSE